MKFIGILMLIVIGNALERGVTVGLIFWFLVGLGLVFFDVITHWMKVEISSSKRRRY